MKKFKILFCCMVAMILSSVMFEATAQTSNEYASAMAQYLNNAQMRSQVVSTGMFSDYSVSAQGSNLVIKLTMVPGIDFGTLDQSQRKALSDAMTDSMYESIVSGMTAADRRQFRELKVNLVIMLLDTCGNNIKGTVPYTRF